jgi:hypothetical protein
MGIFNLSQNPYSGHNVLHLPRLLNKAVCTTGRFPKTHAGSRLAYDRYTTVHLSLCHKMMQAEALQDNKNQMFESWGREKPDKGSVRHINLVC